MSGCTEFQHLGPVLPTGDVDVIDNGFVVTVRCEECGAVGEVAVDLDEVSWL